MSLAAVHTAAALIVRDGNPPAPWLPLARLADERDCWARVACLYLADATSPTGHALASDVRAMTDVINRTVAAS